MTRVDELYALTLKLKEILREPVSSDERADVITEINDLLEQRDVEMAKIKPPYTKTEQDLGQKVIELNQVIDEDLKKLFKSLKKDITQFTQQKKSNRSYINPYGKMTSTDGMYVDSKQ